MLCIASAVTLCVCVCVLLQPDGPYDVTLVNRHYNMGRSMVNTAKVIESMKEMEEVSSVK